jgi:hypothetical protein
MVGTDKKKLILFAFDCGDFINPEADDTLKYWTDLLTRYKIKGKIISQAFGKLRPCLYRTRT